MRPANSLSSIPLPAILNALHAPGVDLMFFIGNLQGLGVHEAETDSKAVEQHGLSEAVLSVATDCADEALCLVDGRRGDAEGVDEARLDEVGVCVVDGSRVGEAVGAEESHNLGGADGGDGVGVRALRARRGVDGGKVWRGWDGRPGVLVGPAVPEEDDVPGRVGETVHDVGGLLDKVRLKVDVVLEDEGGRETAADDVAQEAVVGLPTREGARRLCPRLARAAEKARVELVRVGLGRPVVVCLIEAGVLESTDVGFLLLLLVVVVVVVAGGRPAGPLQNEVLPREKWDGGIGVQAQVRPD